MKSTTTCIHDSTWRGAANAYTPGRNQFGGKLSAKIRTMFYWNKWYSKARKKDFMLYTKTEQPILTLLRRFFEIYTQRKLIILLEKSKFLQMQRNDAVKLLTATAAILIQITMRHLKPQWTPKMQSLFVIFHCRYLDGRREICLAKTYCAAYRIFGNPTQRRREPKENSRKMLSFSKSWDYNYVLAFKHVKMSLREAVESSRCDEASTICVHTEASDRFWSGIATRCNPTELE